MNTFFKKIVAIIMTIIMFLPYMTSFLSKNLDNNFEIETNAFYNGKLKVNKNAKIYFEENDFGFFNYFGLKYQTDAYLKGTITYIEQYEEKSEDFFLKPDENEFYSFTDNYLQKKKATKLLSLEFTVLNKESAEIDIKGISVFNRNVEDEVLYKENDFLKIGIDLHWGGALSYLEDLDSNVEVIEQNGKIKVDSNAGKRYSEKVLNKSVNLINCADSGRLVQQSFYGTFDGGYEGGEFIGQTWNYNPVQGGNKYNDSSKIVDLKINENSLYVKCRPLDWSLPKDKITPSYMESTYTLDGDKLHVECSFTDFSGYPETFTTQEMPAFYCIEPLDHFYYCDGGEIKVKDDLIFWPDAGYPHFNSSENWVAFSGEFDDSFAIGLHVPNGTDFLAGIYDHGKTQNKNPSADVATSYVALVRWLTFKSYTPIEYDYTITTGTIEEIREKFTES